MYYHTRYYHPERAERDKELTDHLGQLICDQQFLNDDGVNKLLKSMPGIEMIDNTPLSDASLKGKYWFIEIKGRQEIAATDRINKALENGGKVDLYSGPYDTEDEANDACDAAWESPGKSDD